MTKDERINVRSRLEASLVPGIVGPLKVEDAQEFAIEGDGFPSFFLEPVRYLSQDPSGGSSYRCGVFVVTAGQPNFLATVGYEWTEAVQCSGLEGVGFMPGDVHRPPRILMLYAAASPNASVKEPFVLDWNAASSRYVGNEKLSRRLEDDDKAVGILGIKRQLKKYAGNSPQKSSK